jgi:SNF2 family DNA or RNA helicase
VDVVVTTYDTLNSDVTHMVRMGVWKCVVLDEGHRIRHHGTKSEKSVSRLKTDQRIVLTG